MAKKKQRKQHQASLNEEDVKRLMHTVLDEDDEVRDIGFGILVVIFIIIYSLLNYCSRKSDSKEISAESEVICQKLLEATNIAFQSNEGLGRDATIFKLKAVKSNVSHQWKHSDEIDCDVYIKNEGNYIIQGIYGEVYYFDKDNVSDSTVFYNTTVILPQETVKISVDYLPNNISKMEIRDADGNKGFRYQWDVKSDGTY